MGLRIVGLASQRVVTCCCPTAVPADGDRNAGASGQRQESPRGAPISRVQVRIAPRQDDGAQQQRFGLVDGAGRIGRDRMDLRRYRCPAGVDPGWRQ